VTRLSQRLGLTRHTDAVKIEQDLIPIVPQQDWTLWAHLMISHGRAVCQARKPDCRHCVIFAQCPSGPALIKSGAAREPAE
jgi:endonuclease III